MQPVQLSRDDICHHAAMIPLPGSSKCRCSTNATFLKRCI
jgi:hypothetical protein